MTSLQWEPRSFSIATPNGSTPVEGIVCGPFGLHVKEGRRPVFGVTHLPSGMRATPGGGAGFTNLEMAQVFAERLMGLADWNRIDQKTADERLAVEVVAIWNELIALDTAKTTIDQLSATGEQVSQTVRR
jgi:hypothetical protein